MKLEDVIQSSTRALQPAFSAVGVGTLYRVSDEGGALERATASGWESVGGGGGGGGGSVQGSFLVGGGQVAWESAYVFGVSAASYYIGGVHYASLEDSVTLSAAHATLHRIDVIAVDIAGAVVVVEGTAAAQPSEPDVDPATQLKLGIVLVDAASVTPTVTSTVLYAENAGPAGEWTWSTSGSGFALASTNNPRSGTKDIEGTTVANNAYAQGLIAAPINPNSYTRLVFYVRSKAAWASGRVLRVHLLLAGVLKGTPLTLASGYWGFDSALTASYQLVSIPMAQFGIPDGTLIDQLRFVDSGGSIGFYIDDVALQSGGTSEAAPSGLSQDQADARYAPLVHASRHLTGGADAIKIDDLAAGDDNTDLNASTTKHGLLKKLDNNAAHFLDGTGAWATPAGAGDVVGPASAVDDRIATFDGASGKLLQDGGSTLAAVAAAALAAATAIKIDDLAAADDNTDLNASASAHGLLPKLSGNAAQFLNGAGAYTTPAGAGDVVGPASAVNNSLAQFDGTTGKLLEDSGATVAAVLATALAAAAPIGASYVAIATHADLTHERVLTGTANQVVVTDSGAGAAVTLSLPQSINTGATPQFARVGLGAAAHASAALKVVGQAYSPLVDNGNSGTTKTLDWDTGNEQFVTMTGNCTFTLSNPVDGGRYVVLLASGAGGFTGTWPASVLWPGGVAPVLTVAASKLDLVTLIWVAGVSKYLGSFNLNY